MSWPPRVPTPTTAMLSRSLAPDHGGVRGGGEGRGGDAGGRGVEEAPAGQVDGVGHRLGLDERWWVGWSVDVIQFRGFSRIGPSLTGPRGDSQADRRVSPWLDREAGVRRFSATRVSLRPSGRVHWWWPGTWPRVDSRGDSADWPSKRHQMGRAGSCPIRSVRRARRSCCGSATGACTCIARSTTSPRPTQRPGLRRGGFRRGDDVGDRPVPDGLRARGGGAGRRSESADWVGFSRRFSGLRRGRGRKNPGKSRDLAPEPIFPVCFRRPRRKGSAGAAVSGLTGGAGTVRLAKPFANRPYQEGLTTHGQESRPQGRAEGRRAQAARPRQESREGGGPEAQAGHQVRDLRRPRREDQAEQEAGRRGLRGHERDDRQGPRQERARASSSSPACSSSRSSTSPPPRPAPASTRSPRSRPSSRPSRPARPSRPCC